MYFRAAQSSINRASLMALLLALLALWATVAIAGMNKDLIEAASRGNLTEIKRLLAKGADVNAKTTKDGAVPMHFAAYSGRKEVVELLIAKGADVNARSNDGKTPLHSAAQNGHSDIVELLHDHGGME